MRIGIFCGSNRGNGAEFVDAARSLARFLIARGIGIVYGGGSVGLMGELADAVLSDGGEVIGVIPRALWEMAIVESDASVLLDRFTTYEPPTAQKWIDRKET